MMRGIGLGLVIGLAASALNAQAETPAASASCPRGPVSIYFSAGDVTTSPQTLAVLGKIHEAATECGADQIDVVAHVDGAEGDRSLNLALSRLSLVADELVQLGLPASHIRVATEAPDTDGRTDVARRQIDIQFRKKSEPPREDLGASRPPAVTVPSNVI